jgi:hypothetical protein
VGSSIRGTVTGLPAESAVSFEMTNSLTLKPIAATADDLPPPK